MIYVISITCILLIFISYLAYRYNKYKKIELQKKIKEKEKEERIKKLKLLKIRAKLEQQRVNEEKRKAEEQWEKNISGKCEPIKLSLYDTYNLNLEVSNLYKKVICKNLWINEPFHTKFYEFLMIINDNNFMIIDPHSNVITMNVRDKYNKVESSKSYQVYSTKDIIVYVIANCMDNIKKFNRKDAQNILIAIFVLILEQSVHYQSKEDTQDSIDCLLKGYDYAQNIREIVKFVKVSVKQVYFIRKSINNAFTIIKTLPYNDSESERPLQIKQKLPPKTLQKI